MGGAMTFVPGPLDAAPKAENYAKILAMVQRLQSAQPTPRPLTEKARRDMQAWLDKVQNQYAKTESERTK